MRKLKISEIQVLRCCCEFNHASQKHLIEADTAMFIISATNLALLVSLASHSLAALKGHSFSLMPLGDSITVRQIDDSSRRELTLCPNSGEPAVQTGMDIAATCCGHLGDMEHVSISSDHSTTVK